MKGLLLAGGFSRRFGQDKAVFTLPGSAENLAEHGMNLLASLPDVESVYLSCRRAQLDQYRKTFTDAVGIIPEPDHGQIATPLFGLIAALTHLRSSLIVLPCDMPCMRADIMALLLETRKKHIKANRNEPLPLRYAFEHDDGRVETLAAIYEFESLPYLESALKNQRFGAFSAIPQHLTKCIPCPREDVFMNMNWLDDMKRLTLSL